MKKETRRKRRGRARRKEGRDDGEVASMRKKSRQGVHNKRREGERERERERGR